MAGITIEVDLDSQKFKRGLSDIGKTAAQSGKAAGQKFENGFSNALSVINVATGNIVADIAIKAANAIKNFAVGTIQAANRQEDAVNSLNAALKRTGSFSESASKDLQDFAAAIERVTTFGDEAVLEQLAFAKSLGLTSQQAKDVLTAATNLSAALGISLESAVRNIAKTFSGLGGELSELVPTVRALTQEQLRAGEAANVINREFFGAAESRTETTRGAFAQLTNSIGSFSEALGAFVTRNELVQKSLKTTKSFFDFLTEAITPDPIKEQAETISILQQRLDSLIKTRGRSSKAVRETIDLIEQEKRVLQSLIVDQKALEDRQSAERSAAEKKASQERISTVLDESNKRIELLGSLGLTELQILENNYLLQQKQLADAFEGRFDLEEDFLTRSFELRRQFEEAERALKESQVSPLEEQQITYDNFFESVTAGLEGLARTTSVTGKDIAKSIQQGIGGGAARGFAAFGRAIVTGENALGAFADALFQSIAQQAVALGTNYVLTGTAMLFSPNPKDKAQAPFLIKSGAALATFGGALGALGGGGASPSGAQPGSPADNFNNGFTETQTPQEDLREAQATVTVNIQGDVLDGETSALRVAELVQRAVNDQGFRFA